MLVGVNQKFNLQNFAPVWGASVMGTGVISSVFNALAAQNIIPTITSALATAFLIVASLIAIPVLGITSLRWIKYPKDVMQDLGHPIKGAMSATFAGAFLVLAVAVSTRATALALLLTAIGAGLAVFIGFVFLSGIFARGSTQPGQVTGAWFIPPVVTIIVPTAVAPTLVAAGGWQNELFWLSWVFLGIGSMLYLVVVATLFYRTATAPLPPAGLAPTLLIGMGPAGLIGLNLVLLAETAERIGLGGPALAQLSAGAATLIWGFGLWWGVATIFVLKRGYEKLPFALTWWGFTFPLGAWVVAGLIIASVTSSTIVLVISLLGAVILLTLWVYVLIKTLQSFKSGAVWAA